MEPRRTVGLSRDMLEQALRTIHSIQSNYENEWERVLNMFLPCLMLPENSKVFEPEEAMIPIALLCISGVVEALRWCGSHRQSPVTEATIARIYEQMDSCLYWCLRALRVPATPDSEPASEAFCEGDSGTRCYLLPVHFLGTFPSVFTRFFDELVRMEATLHVAIAFWTGLYDGRVPLYRDHKRDPDYFTDQEEHRISVFLDLVKANPNGMCNAIMNGRICTPEMFVTRTRQRLAGLLQIHRLPYLAESVPTPTPCRLLERTLLTTGRAKGMLGSDQRDFSLLIAKKMVSPTWPFGGDEGERTAVSKNVLLTLPVAAALKMAAASPKSTLFEIKKVFEAGVAELAVWMFVTVLPWLKAMRGRVDDLWEAIERYGLYLEILPVVAKGLRTRPFPPESKPNFSVGRQDLPDLTKKILALEASA
ncbi:hypothetical protein FA13DRAFT_1795981 [Coprinellus micaceus]|uniref:Uncharacterized protein n=1 Tax=Coprinellus micaceus TaxID=71717 RepID=A0A4Y7SW84_COPMI|nr:hypothetical protein FA13DRAFT_1795981 [Coprinellus micaceus]